MDVKNNNHKCNYVSNDYDKHGWGVGGHHYHNNVGNWNMNMNCYGGNILFQCNGNLEWGT